MSATEEVYWRFALRFFFPLTELCCFLKSEAPDSDNASGCTVYVKGRGTTCKTEERQTESEENSFDWF